MAHPVFLSAGNEERLVRVADDVFIADMPDEEVPVGERDLEPGREALGTIADRSSFTNVFDQADGEIEEARTGRDRPYRRRPASPERRVAPSRSS